MTESEVIKSVKEMQNRRGQIRRHENGGENLMNYNNNITPVKRNCQTDFHFFSIINNLEKKVICYGRKVKLKHKREGIEILCPFCFDEKKGYIYHIHGYTPGITARESHCNSEKFPGTHTYYITAVEAE